MSKHKHRWQYWRGETFFCRAPDCYKKLPGVEIVGKEAACPHCLKEFVVEDLNPVKDSGLILCNVCRTGVVGTQEVISQNIRELAIQKAEEERTELLKEVVRLSSEALDDRTQAAQILALAQTAEAQLKQRITAVERREEILDKRMERLLKKERKLVALRDSLRKRMPKPDKPAEPVASVEEVVAALEGIIKI